MEEMVNEAFDLHNGKRRRSTAKIFQPPEIFLYGRSTVPHTKVYADAVVRSKEYSGARPRMVRSLKPKPPLEILRPVRFGGWPRGAAAIQSIGRL